MFQPISTSFTIEGHQLPITIETGKLARQANGSVIVRQGNCAIIATACASESPRQGQSFFPLTVDYMEKFSAAGRIPGSFFKREGRLSNYEILVSRLIDRALRPLFPSDYLCDVQVMITLVSSDPEVLPDSLACLAASAALSVSNIPIKEILSEVRVAKVDGSYVINPTRTQLKNSTMDFLVAATERNLVMVEGEAKECQEDELIKGLEVAHEAIRQQVSEQEKLRQQVGEKSVKGRYEKPAQDELIQKEVCDALYQPVVDAFGSEKNKAERKAKWSQLFEEFLASKKENWTEEEQKLAKEYYAGVVREAVRNITLDQQVRIDGRSYVAIRPIEMEIDYLPSPHGCALFTRGETQALASVTLGTSVDELMVESAVESNYSKFFLHYNFPPFSTGEARPLRGPARREVGHGNLALRSLMQIFDQEASPYTVRIVSDILESNGSSSMATVCAGSLALMDAGIPFKKHVAGISMGLIERPSDKKYAILTDILGDEDHLGDMDFKITGTRDGICGVQMDMKVDGLSMDVMREALVQAKDGRLSILEKMYNCTPESRKNVKPHAPRYERITVETEFIGAIIGPQGKVIKEMQRATNTTITIEEKNNKGEVLVYAVDEKGLHEALELIKQIVTVPKVGEEYEAEVKTIQPYGAFVEFLPGKQGLLHVSEINWERVEKVEDVLKVGEKIQVKLVGTDPKTGKYKFSRKVLIPKP